MRVYSLNFDQKKINDVTVDLSLLPGLPSLYLLGDVSRELKECLPKLKSAFLHQGFKWPRTRQVVVELRTTAGVAGREAELAIAVALLRATGQLVEASEYKDFYFVGEISLEGKVKIPHWPRGILQFVQDRKILGGLGWSEHYVEDLSQLKAPSQEPLHTLEMFWQRPELPTMHFSSAVAELVALIAAGEHPALFAGPPGTGKTTLVEAIYAVLGDLSKMERQKLQVLHQLYSENINWRPKIAPHHSSSALALLGGGSPPQPGEVTRAHGGILFLDEYLEFSPKVQEALREPLERGEIRVARGPHAAVFAADFLLLAATNLCPCGRLSPQRNFSCGYSLTRCRATLQKLSGPMLDRFQVLGLSHKWAGERSVALSEIHERVKSAVARRQARGQVLANGKVRFAELKSLLNADLEPGLPPLEGSERRQQALLCVAQTLADLDGKSLGFEHISRALSYAVTPHYELGQLFA